jgi:hypothetical protein
MQIQELKVLVTRVPAPLAAQVEQMAKDEMLPVAALIRRLLAFAVNGRKIAA